MGEMPTRKATEKPTSLDLIELCFSQEELVERFISDFL
jgi:hypothetical protein